MIFKCIQSHFGIGAPSYSGCQHGGGQRTFLFRSYSSRSTIVASLFHWSDPSGRNQSSFLSSKACILVLGYLVVGRVTGMGDLDTHSRNVDAEQGLMIPLINIRTFRAVEVTGGHMSCEVSLHSAGRMVRRSGEGPEGSGATGGRAAPECLSLAPAMLLSALHPRRQPQAPFQALLNSHSFLVNVALAKSCFKTQEPAYIQSGDLPSRICSKEAQSSCKSGPQAVRVGKQAVAMCHQSTNLWSRLVIRGTKYIVRSWDIEISVLYIRCSGDEWNTNYFFKCIEHFRLN